MATAPEDFAQEGRVAAQLNAFLKSHGYTDAAITLWWNKVRYPQLGNRTATQAWLTGSEEDREAVRHLVETVAAEDQEWEATMRAAVANGLLKDRLAAQPTPRAIVDRWRAGGASS